MTKEEREEDFPEQDAALRSLPRRLEPPPELEERVVGALRARGLLREAGIRRRIMLASAIRLAAALAAAIVLVGSGWLLGRRAAPGAGEPPGERFLLVLYEGSDFRAREDDIPRLVTEYAEWARELRARGHLVEAEKLADDGRLVEVAGGEVVSEATVPRGPIGAMTGFFLIEARDYAEAAAIAGGSPHLRYGGRISVRRIEPT